MEIKLDGFSLVEEIPETLITNNHLFSESSAPAFI